MRSTTSSRSPWVRAPTTTSAPASASPIATPRPIPWPPPVTIATLSVTRKLSRITGPSPATAQVGGGTAGDQRQVEVGLDTGPGRDDVRDRADAVVGRGHDPGVADQAVLDGLGLQPLEGQLHRRISGDLHLEPLTFRAEAPAGVEMLLPHQPVHRRGHDRYAVHERAPVEPPGGDQA